MTPTATRSNPVVELARCDAMLAATQPARIADALRRMADELDPLNAATSAPLGAGSITDPTGDTASDRADNGLTGRSDMRRLLRLVHERYKITVDVEGVLDRWASIQTRGNRNGATVDSADWCANPAHPAGSREPRHGRHRHCRWCCAILAQFGRLPTRHLIDLHDRGIRFSQTTLVRHFKDNPTR